MPTTAQRILEYLNAHPEGADDDELTAALELSHRAAANIICRRFADQKLIQRQRVDGKFRNYGLGQTLPPSHAGPTVSESEERPWFWEGHVQDKVVKYLGGQGYTILRVADTAAHEPGKDIVAKKNGHTLWVSVKGYPRGTERTNPAAQSRVWFEGAMFDMLDWRGQADADTLALAFPDFRTYHHLLAKVAWARPVVRFDVLWVAESGAVSQEPLVAVTPDH